jgi:hypothetical protein
MIVRLRVGGITLRVLSRQALPSLLLRKPYTSFSPRRGGDIRIRVLRSLPQRPPESELLFDSGGLWRVYGRNGGLFYSFLPPDGEAELGRALGMAPNGLEGDLYLPPSPWDRKRGYALMYPLDELIFQHHAARTGRLFVHACAVETNGRVLLFCGQSGAGKTTTARLWRRHRPAAAILSDDRSLIQETNGTLWAYGTPWHGLGKYASPAGRPLAAIIFLRHGAESGLEPLSKLEAAVELFSRSFYPPWEAGTVGSVLQYCERITTSIPCHRLSFRPDASAIQVVEEWLGIPVQNQHVPKGTPSYGVPAG